MAGKSGKSSGSGGSANNRVRFILVEAEGDLSGIAQAITDAVRPVIAQRIPAPPVLRSELEAVETVLGAQGRQIE